MSEERIPEAWAWEKPVAGGTWMTDVRIGWGKPSPDATKFNLRPLYSDPDGAEKELSALRTQNAEQAERIRELEAAIDEQMVAAHVGVFNAGDDPKIAIGKLMDWSQSVGDYFGKDELREQLRAALVRARSQALYDAADDFESGASASDIRANADAILSGQPEHTPLQLAGEEDKAIYAKMAANYQGQPVEDKGE